jgi:aminoglycoside phosphotransferase (APT) family kinase protein
VKLPEHTPIAAEALAAILTRHALDDRPLAPLAQTGIINAVYALGDDLVLRVPRDHPAHAEQARREALAIPAARAAGVRTPRLVAYDDRLDLLPVPYLIVERVGGAALGQLVGDPAAATEVWREVGRDLARLHAVPRTGAVAELAPGTNPPEPIEMIERRLAEGWFSALEARWLRDWVERLRPMAAPPPTPRLLHGDVQSTNVMVDPESPTYHALIDWGCAHWGDPAIDLLGTPLRCAPPVLAGHREIAELDGDDTAEARIVWHHLGVVLWFLPRGAVPGVAWGEQPIAMLLDLLRFFLETKEARWRSVGPP